MIPILYTTVSEGTVPSNYGVGNLTDCISAKVTEERNGKYELALSYTAEGIHAGDIQPNAFIKVKPNYTDGPQLFRIYKVGKTINGKFEVNAQHISYDLSGKVITTGTASSCVAACALLQAQAGNFTINTDKTVSASFSISEPSSVRSWFGGKSGSLLDVYGGEWKYDNYTASLKQARGADRGVTIRYGKNLTQLSQEIDISNLCTGIVPYYIDGDGNKTVGSKVSTGLVSDVSRDMAIDFSQDVDPESGTAITTQLANLANNYIANNQLTSALNNITLDFVQLEGLTERVDLCDTVRIYFEPLGLSATAKCIATEWDVLEERYTKTTFGNAKTNIADTIASAQKDLAQTPSVSFMADAIAHATELITGNLGGYVILHDANGDGEPDEILIMNTASIDTATQVWRWNKNGLGYATSYAGPYGTAITSDGKIVADYIKTGTLNADLIKAGTIEDAGHNSTINMTTGVAVMKSFTAKGNFNIINDSTSKKMGTIFPYSQGGAIQLNDSNEVGRANLYVTNNGGFLYLYDSSGTNTIGLNAQSGVITASNGMNAASYRIQLQSSTYGGNIIVKNTSDNTSTNIFNGSSGQGEIYIYNGSSTGTVFLHGGNGNITCVSLTQTSSRKVKDNIKPIGDAEKILELDAVSFDYKNKDQGTDKRGFIAEDVAKVLPNLVTPEDGDAPATLDYIGMIPYLQDIIKKQDKRIQALEEKIKLLGG